MSISSLQSKGSVMLPPQEKMFTSPDGTHIWAEEAGDRTKPAIVFIHGLACTALAFNAQFADAELLRSAHLVRYEMRGHGRSGKPDGIEAYASLRHAEDFRTVCEGFGLTKPIVLGWSLGGTIPVDVVRYHGPDYIAGIIYNGGAVLSIKLSGECRHPSLLPLVSRICSPDAHVAAHSAIPFVDSCFANPASLSFEAKMVLAGGFGMQPPAIRHHSLNREQDDRVWRERARGIPVLIVQGTEDTHCAYEKMVAWAKRIYEDVEVLLMQGVGHAPHIEAPQETNRAISAFVKRVGRPPCSSKL